MKSLSPNPNFSIRFANESDVPLLLQFIKELAEYERLSHEVVANEQALRQSLFGDRKAAEALIGEYEGEPVAFAIFFHNFSTFLGKPGLYLEDLYVKPELRGKGIGLAMLQYLASLAKERGCGRFEWWVLDWNESAIGFYKKLGATPMSDWTVFRLTGDALGELASRTNYSQNQPS
ncbi:MAG: GNAT family N-acetyltransferase [Bdellovibrionota bacterium]